MKNVILLTMFFYLATSFLSVSIEPTFIYINYFFGGLFFLISCIYLIKISIVDYNFLKLLSYYYIAILLSIAFGFVALYIFNFEKIAFLNIEIYGRIFNIVLFSILSLTIVSLTGYNKYLTVNSVVSFYAVGCALLILTGYWQASSMYLGLGSFPFETRNWVHGFNKSDYDIEARLTGIAAEPSYFVPFVLDFIILSLIIFKRKIFKILFFSFGLFIMLLSFSPSGFASTAIAFSLALLFCMKNNTKTIKYIFFILLTIPFLIVLLISKVKNLGYVFERLSRISEDGRFKSIYDTLVQFFDSNIINIIFGYGTTNFKVASQYTDYSFLMTSNNLFADVVVEMGIIGLVLMINMFVMLFLNIYNSKNITYQKFVAYALFFDLMVTSMIRADYSTSRFFIIIAIIFLLSKYEFYKKDVV